MRYSECAVYSVACLEWMRWGKRSHAYSSMAIDRGDILWKPHLQKRLRTGLFWGGKHLGCPNGIDRGLRCGLSGNRVLCLATAQSEHEKGTAFPVTGGCSGGKPTRPKPQDLLCLLPPFFMNMEVIFQWRTNQRRTGKDEARSVILRCGGFYPSFSSPC